MNLHRSPSSFRFGRKNLLRAALILLFCLFSGPAAYASCCSVNGGGGRCKTKEPTLVRVQWGASAYIGWDDNDPPPPTRTVGYHLTWVYKGTPKSKNVPIAHSSTGYMLDYSDGTSVMADPGSTVSINVTANWSQIGVFAEVDTGCFGKDAKSAMQTVSASKTLPKAPSKAAGTVGVDVCSMDLVFGMGINSGSIVISAPTLTAADVSPAKLEYSGLVADTVVTNGVLSQIRTSEALAVITPGTTFGFSIQYYHPGQYTGASPGPYQPTGTPFVTYSVVDPGTGSGGVQHAKVIETPAGQAAKEIGFFVFDSAATPPTWTLVRPGEGSRTVVRTPGANPGDYTISITTAELRNGNFVVVGEELETYENDLLMSRRVGPAVGGLTTNFFYQDESKVGFQNTDGMWEWEFTMPVPDDANRVWDAVLRPYGDTPRPLNRPEPTDPAAVSGHLILTHDQVASNVSGPAHRVGTTRRVREYKDGVLVNKTTTDITYNGDVEVTEVRRWAGPNSAETVETTSRYSGSAPQPYTNRLISEGRLDKITQYEYLEGRLDAGEFVVDAAQKDYVQETATETSPVSGLPIPHISMKTVSLYTSGGRAVRSDSYVCISGGATPAYGRLARVEHTFDANGNLTQSKENGVVTYTATWNGSVRISETDDSGVVMEYSNHDPAGRPQTITHKGYAGNGPAAPAQPDVVVNVTFDSLGRELSRLTTSGGVTIGQSIVLDTAGRPLEDHRNGITTFYTYAPVNGAVGATTTETLPGGLTRVTESYLDGRPKSVTGSAVVPTSYAYGVETSGAFAGMEYTSIERGSQPEPIWEKSIADWRGRRVALVRLSPDGNNGFSTRTFTYDNQGRLTQEFVDDIVPVLVKSITRDEGSGNQMTETLYLGGGMQPSSMVTTVTYEEDGGGVWHQKTTQTAGGIVRSITKHQAARVSLGGGLARVAASETINEAGDIESVVANVDPASKLRSLMTSRTGMQNALETRIRNGRVEAAEVTADKSASVNTYDALGRLVSASDPRTGYVWQMSYHAAFPDRMISRSVVVPAGADPASGQNSTITQAYYGAGQKHAGRVLSRVENGTTTYYRYDDLGQVSHVWGDTHPIQYQRDAHGRLWKMITYRSLPAGFDAQGASFDAGLWTGGDETVWTYVPGTTLAATKFTAGAPGVQDGTLYQYDRFGNLETRTTANGNSTFTYDLQNRVIGVSYSNESVAQTPPVTYASPDALGRYTVVTDGQGSRELVYGPRGLVTSETRTGASTGNYVLTRTEVPWGRLGGISLSVEGAPAIATTYAYDSVTGRLASLTDGAFSANYGYHAGSNELHTTLFKVGGTNLINRSMTIDGLSRLHRIQDVNASNATVLNRHTYGYDSRHRRETVEDADGREWTYGYNQRNEVTSGGRALANGTPMLGHAFGYQYDGAGNRATSTVNGRQSAYTVNEENQIAGRTVPNGVDVLGTSPSGNVRVNLEEPQWQGSDFYSVVTGDNSAAGRWLDIQVAAYAAGQNGQPDRVKHETGKLFLPKNPQDFGYDACGNLVADGRWTYQWNAQGRMVVAHDATSTPPVRITYGYDALGRRVEKKKSHFVSGNWSEVEHRSFYYDGLTLIAESVKIQPGQHLVDRKYVWGCDLGGGLQSAGNVGGLSFVHALDGQANWKTLIPLYDGNGNIVSALDTSSSQIVASFTYSPTGETIARKDTTGGLIRFGWCTRPVDSDTKLVEFAWRDYSPLLGRWLSRDPIEESGGANLYGYCGNDPVNRFDMYGLYEAEYRISVWMEFEAKWEQESILFQGNLVKHALDLFYYQEAALIEYTLKVKCEEGVVSHELTSGGADGEGSVKYYGGRTFGGLASRSYSRLFPPPGVREDLRSEIMEDTEYFKGQRQLSADHHFVSKGEAEHHEYKLGGLVSGNADRVMGGGEKIPLAKFLKHLPLFGSAAAAASGWYNMIVGELGGWKMQWKGGGSWAVFIRLSLKNPLEIQFGKSEKSGNGMNVRVRIHQIK